MASLQLLQCLAVDVPTKGRLGKCLAVRVEDVLLLLGKEGVDNPLLSRGAVETALAKSSSSSRSQQRFLKPSSTDTTLQKSRKGVGGNTTTERCFIVAQSHLDHNCLEAIREGGSSAYSALDGLGLCIDMIIITLLSISTAWYQQEPLIMSQEIAAGFTRGMAEPQNQHGISISNLEDKDQEG